MESTNFHHPQDQPPPVSSLSTPSFGVEGTTHSWTPNITLNNNACNFNSNLQEENPRSRSTVTPKNNMIQDLGYNNHHWTSDAGVESCLNSNQFIKEEISFSNNFPKFSELLNYTTPNSNMENYGILSSTTTNTTQMKNINNDEHKDMNYLMLKTLFTHGDFYNAQNHLNFRGNNISSQIHPSINIPNLNQYSSSTTSNTLDMNMQSLDLLTNSPSSFTTQHSQDHDNLSFRLHPMQQQPTNRSSSSNSMNNHNGAGETKRGCTLIESKASQSQTAFKKSRSSSSESRPSSCPPFKVRKEKLGDRIAALQQLVAPFGKTDTASVLMEAIGYIKFLQGQVETLSVPYMKSSQKQNMQGGSGTCDTNREAKQHLISRGLCLVPLSCMSYIATTDEMWQQRPNFGGPT